LELNVAYSLGAEPSDVGSEPVGGKGILLDEKPDGGQYRPKYVVFIIF